MIQNKTVSDKGLRTRTRGLRVGSLQAVPRWPRRGREGGSIYAECMYMQTFVREISKVASEALGITKLMLRLLEGHLKNIIPNAFTKECFLVTIQAEGKPPSKTTGRADLDVLRTVAERSVGIQAQGVFKTRAVRRNSSSRSLQDKTAS